VSSSSGAFFFLFPARLPLFDDADGVGTPLICILELGVGARDGVEVDDVAGGES